MKPIFISYSQEQRDLAKTLACRLEGEAVTLPDGTAGRLTVWWDQDVCPGESFMGEINRALREAPAVIVIWSEDAVESDWVPAEALRARDQRKLVTVLADGLDPQRIPVPFNAVYACPLDDHAAILTALQKLIGGERTELPANAPGAFFCDGLIGPKQPLPVRAEPVEISTLVAGTDIRRIGAKTMGRFVLLGLAMVGLPSSDVVTRWEPHTVRIGYRAALFPFSFRDSSGQPAGYSIDICNAVVEEMRRNHADLKVEYVKVTSETRLQAVRDGRVDLECGTTTNNLERRKLGLAFSPLIFATGTRVMVPVGMDYHDVHDLAGLRVAVARDTTNAQALEELDRANNLGITFIKSADEEESYRELESGRADAFATDAVLLDSMIAQHGARDRFKVVGDLLTDDPYGIAFRRNEPELHAAVERAVRNLVTRGDIYAIYRKWFESPHPNGERLHMPMSPRLAESFKVLAEGGKSE